MNNTEIKTPLNYKVRKAVNPKNSPALVLLHGYGSNMLDLFALNQFFSENWTIISLQGPVPTAFGGFAWAELDFTNLRELPLPQQKVESIEKIHESISIFSKSLDLDKNNIFILGFSQGADLALSTSFKFPNAFKGIMALCGYFDVKKIDYTIDENAIKKLNLFLCSAIYDEKVPVHLGRMTNLSLKKLGLETTYHEYETGHTISNQCLNDLLEWLDKIEK